MHHNDKYLDKSSTCTAHGGPSLAVLTRNCLFICAAYYARSFGWDQARIHLHRIKYSALSTVAKDGQIERLVGHGIDCCQPMFTSPLNVFSSMWRLDNWANSHVQLRRTQPSAECGMQPDSHYGAMVMTFINIFKRSIYTVSHSWATCGIKPAFTLCREWVCQHYSLSWTCPVAFIDFG